MNTQLTTSLPPLPPSLPLPRFLQHAPMVFLTSAIAPTIIQCSLVACSLNHRDAFSSVMKFYRDLMQLHCKEDIVSAVCYEVLYNMCVDVCVLYRRMERNSCDCQQSTHFSLIMDNY